MLAFRRSRAGAARVVHRVPWQAAPVPGFSTKRDNLLEKQGLPMSEQEAVERITFHPFVPATNYRSSPSCRPSTATTRTTRRTAASAYEYVSGGLLYILREWPLAGGSLDKYPSVPPVGTCRTGHLALGTPKNPRGYAWTTATLAFTLQPDVDSGVTPTCRR